jgi:hypothetical protein
MADQTSLKGTGASPRDNGEAPERRVVGGLAEFVNDIATLIELQLKLAMLDFREAMQKATISLGLMVGGAVLFTAALPIVLLGVAELVAAALKISPAWGMVLTGGVVGVVALVAAAVSARKIGPAFASSFRRSREELTRNLAWVRTVLLYSGRSIPPRR